MMSILRRIFGVRASGRVAKQRMQFVLMHDRVDITPDIMENVKNDILAVLSRYMELDGDSLTVDLERGKDFTALVSNVQVKRVYRRAMRD